MREMVVTKVVKKWMFKYHFSIIKTKNQVILKETIKKLKTINVTFVYIYGPNN